jgi:hypothetical protein
VQGSDTFKLFISFLRSLVAAGHDVQLVTATENVLVNYRLTVARLRQEAERAVWGFKTLMIFYTNGEFKGQSVSYLVPVGAELATTLRASVHAGEVMLSVDCWRVRH